MNGSNQTLTLGLVVIALAATSCSTSTQTSNALATTSSILAIGANSESGHISGGIPLGPIVKHQISLNGTILCSTPLPNFNSLQIELWEKGKPVTIITPDDTGNFSSVLKSQTGNHELRLIRKKDGQTLDKIEFRSDKNNDRFNLNLKGC